MCVCIYIYIYIIHLYVYIHIHTYVLDSCSVLSLGFPWFVAYKFARLAETRLAQNTLNYIEVIQIMFKHIMLQVFQCKLSYVKVIEDILI